MRILVGQTAGGENVFINEEQFRRGGYFVGLSGCGKSTLMADVFLQVIAGGNPKYGAILLDPAGDLAKDALKRIPQSRREDVIYIDPLEQRDHPIALNPFAPLRDDAHVDFIAAEIMGVFRLLLEEYWDSTPEAALRNVTIALLSSRDLRVLGERWWPALDEVAPLLLLESVDDETKPWHKRQVTTYREKVWYPGLEEADLAQAYQWFQTYDRLTPNPKARTAHAIVSKLDRFVSIAPIRNMVCQEGSIDFQQVINEGKIVIVNLREDVLGDMGSFLASVIMAKVLAAIYHQTELEVSQRPPFAIFADEFHEYATESLLRLYQRGRKCGSTVWVAHTDRGWLRPWQRSRLENAQNTFCFNLAPSDALEMARIFDATPPAATEDEFKPRYALQAGLHVPTSEVCDYLLDCAEARLSDIDELAAGVVVYNLEAVRSWIKLLFEESQGENSDAVEAMLHNFDTSGQRLTPDQAKQLHCMFDEFRARTGLEAYIQERVVYPYTPERKSAARETGPVFDKVPGRPRLYSDVYQQIANELCHQPDYQARCRLTGLAKKAPELAVQTLPLSAENASWQDDFELFKHAARQYGESVEAVIHQLRKRDETRRRALEGAEKRLDGGDGYDASPQDQGKRE